MQIRPVHNCCALDFVIGDFYEKCAGSRVDSKVVTPSILPWDANSQPPLYTKRAAFDRTAHPPANPPTRKQP
jgi:hypothetical protein